MLYVSVGLSTCSYGENMFVTIGNVSETRNRIETKISVHTVALSITSYMPSPNFNPIQCCIIISILVYVSQPQQLSY